MLANPKPLFAAVVQLVKIGRKERLDLVMKLSIEYSFAVSFELSQNTTEAEPTKPMQKNESMSNTF
jgi:hypothetical protein